MGGRKGNPPYVHPDRPTPRPCHILWHTLDEMQYTPIKMMWIGGSLNWRFGYYLPAVISYRPGIQHRLAIDFTNEQGRWATGNRKRSHLCARLGIAYMTIRRQATRAEMMTEIRSMITQLRENSEYTPVDTRGRDETNSE